MAISVMHFSGIFGLYNNVFSQIIHMHYTYSALYAYYTFKNTSLIFLTKNVNTAFSGEVCCKQLCTSSTQICHYATMPLHMLAQLTQNLGTKK